MLVVIWVDYMLDGFLELSGGSLNTNLYFLMIKLQSKLKNTQFSIIPQSKYVLKITNFIISKKLPTTNFNGHLKIQICTETIVWSPQAVYQQSINQNLSHKIKIKTLV
jgi:hypothetical protein